MILFEKVTKRFGGVTALEDISFTIDKGEFVFLTGASGAGKSTIIKLILGEYFPTNGSIEIDGEKLDKKSKRKNLLWRRKLGVIFQDYRLFPDRTITENVALPLLIRKTSEGEIKEKTQKALALVGLSERANLFPSQLSGGELQRTALARALVFGPEIILADEPTGNLDAKNTEEIMSLFKEINKGGTTILMATHDDLLIKGFKGRIIEIKEGKIIKDGKENPEHKK